MTEITKLKGKMVITKDAFNVGEITEANMDNNWKITHIQVKLTKEATKELGLKKPYLGHVTICLPVFYVRSIGDVITLSTNRNDLKEIPECKID
jgi:sporulation protein YlmC with PRC-barrel domain